MKTESQALADVYADVRKLTKYFYSKVKDTDIDKRFVANGVALNSIHWIMAHLVWAEDIFLNKALTGHTSEISWLDDFKLGSDPDEASLPPIDEILLCLNETHDRALKNIISISETQLDEPTENGLKFGPVDSKRNIIHHAIRHEPMHTGHLSWIARMNSIKII